MGPVYHGHMLIYWLHQFTEADGLDDRREARDAVRSIGTNGIPVLLEMIALKEPPAKKKGLSWIERQRLVQIYLPSPDEERYLGACGFELLGPDGHSAVPALTQLAASTNLNVRILALRSLASAEPKLDNLRPILQQLSQNPDPGVSASATSFLKTFEPVPAAKSLTNNAAR